MTSNRPSLLRRVGKVFLGLLSLVTPIRAFCLFESVALFWFWNGWPSLLAAAFAGLVFLTVVSLAHHAASGRMLFALGEFLIGQTFATYEAVPVSAYTSKFDADHIKRMPLDNNPSPDGFDDRLLRRQHEQGKYEIKAYVVRPTTKRDPVPVEIASYPTAVGTWMFLPYSPDEMEGLEQFNFLHEYGHFSSSSIGRSMTGGIFLTASLFCLALLTFRIQWTLLAIAILTAVIGLLLLRTRTNVANDDVGDVVDEIRADYFALVRSDLAWFAAFPAEKLAKLLCHMPNIELDLLAHRQTAFVAVLETLRRGDIPPPVDQYGIPRRHHIRLLILDALIGVLLIGLSSAFLPATWSAVIIYGAVLLIGIFAAVFSVMMLSTMAGLFTMATTGTKPSEDAMDVVRSSGRDLERLSALLPSIGNRFPKLRRFLGLFSELYDERLSEQQGATHYSLAVSTLTPLFSAEEFDLYADGQSGTVTLFHGKPIDYSVDHTRYHDAIGEMTFHYSSGTVFRLGSQLIWKLRAMVAATNSVVIARTAHGDESDGKVVVQQITVPLVSGSESDGYLQRVSTKRIQSLRAELARVPQASNDAAGQASDLVGTYSDEQVYALFANTSDKELLKRPAFARALLTRMRC